MSTYFCDAACFVNCVDITVIMGVEFGCEVLAFDDVCSAVVVEIINSPVKLSLVEGLNAVGLTDIRSVLGEDHWASIVHTLLKAISGYARSW